MTPLEIQQWCDNESAVNDSNRPLYTPSAMGKPDADLLLAIHHLRATMEDTSSIICRHIYGHQDTKRREGPQVFQDNRPTNPDETLGDSDTDHSWDPDQPPPRSSRSCTQSLAVISNIEADRIASDTAATALTLAHHDPMLTIQPPYPSSKAMLRIRETWITSHSDRHILTAHGTPAIRDYCMAKYKWTDSIFDSVDWKTIGTARKKCSKTELMQTSKIMHDWLPVMHMYGHVTGLQQCPACTHQDETLDHLFHCQHPALTRTRETALTTLVQKGKTLRIPHIFTDTIRGMLWAYFNEQDYNPPQRNQLLIEAVNAQKLIGLHLVPRGYLAKHWLRALQSLCEHAERKLASLIYFIWIEITDSLWKARNDIVHHGNNLNRQADESRIDRSLIWYHTNKQEVLARVDYGLVAYDIEALHTLTLASKRERLRQLDTAKSAFDIEKSIRATGQHTITKFLLPKQPRHDSSGSEHPQTGASLTTGRG